MNRLPGLPVESHLAHPLQEVFEAAWQALCAERPALALLGRPNHLSASMSKAINAAADAGETSRERLIAAAWGAIPGLR